MPLMRKLQYCGTCDFDVPRPCVGAESQGCMHLIEAMRQQASAHTKRREVPEDLPLTGLIERFAAMSPSEEYAPFSGDYIDHENEG